jgi:DNA invertase Pin-like site-specific DNA recombinase
VASDGILDRVGGSVLVYEEGDRKMEDRIDAAYARQSVDKKDSISIKSQFEFCERELPKGGKYKVYKDKGFSGKNTIRPDFQNLLRDIRAGMIRRVVVYKLDRISRSVIDFANLMELFKEHDVEFVSCQEKFDTGTPMGRAMLNICVIFAQLERETIQQRVTDAFYSRCVKGYRMGGPVPYGFDVVAAEISGIKTKKYVASPDNILNVITAFKMYADPQTSLGDIVRFFGEQGITLLNGGFQRMGLSKMLRSPVYVRADLNIYEFFKSQGADIVNDPSDFMGTNGCYLYRPRGSGKRKYDDLTGSILVIAPHEGVIDSDLWLKCRRKTLNNASFQPARKVNRTWLAGKVKCGLCGNALTCSLSPAGVKYFRCSKRRSDKTCKGAGVLHVEAVETAIYEAMLEKLNEFNTLTSQRKEQTNPKLAAIKVELVQIDVEITRLLDSIAKGNETLISYVNEKIEELDTRKQELLSQKSEIETNEVSPTKIVELSRFLNEWDEIAIPVKREVVDVLINKFHATCEYIDIEWKI